MKQHIKIFLVLLPNTQNHKGYKSFPFSVGMQAKDLESEAPVHTTNHAQLSPHCRLLHLRHRCSVPEGDVQQDDDHAGVLLLVAIALTVSGDGPKCSVTAVPGGRMLELAIKLDHTPLAHPHCRGSVETRV